MKKILMCFVLLIMVTGCGGKDFNKDIAKKAEEKGLAVVEKNGVTYLVENYDESNFLATDSRIGLFENKFEIRDSWNIIYTLGTNGDFSSNLPFSKSCNLKEETCEGDKLEAYTTVKNTVLSEFGLDIEDYGFGK